MSTRVHNCSQGSRHIIEYQVHNQVREQIIVPSAENQGVHRSLPIGSINDHLASKHFIEEFINRLTVKLHKYQMAESTYSRPNKTLWHGSKYWHNYVEGVAKNSKSVRLLLAATFFITSRRVLLNILHKRSEITLNIGGVLMITHNLYQLQLPLMWGPCTLSTTHHYRWCEGTAPSPPSLVSNHRFSKRQTSATELQMSSTRWKRDVLLSYDFYKSLLFTKVYFIVVGENCWEVRCPTSTSSEDIGIKK